VTVEPCGFKFPGEFELTIHKVLNEATRHRSFGRLNYAFLADLGVAMRSSTSFTCQFRRGCGLDEVLLLHLQLSALDVMLGMPASIGFQMGSEGAPFHVGETS
jgi:hypothetical protein